MRGREEFTESQRCVIEHRDGPLLVLAGPGSGKTRVVTHRIARLVNSGVHPWQLLAITFTNKAANEMKSRVEKLIPDSQIEISTFHRFCSRLLRKRAEYVGLRSNFSILDTTAQQNLVRRVLNDLDLDAVHYSPGKVQSRISRAKNDMISADQFTQQFEETIGDHFEAVVARVYPRYQQYLLESNAVDFDDLLLHVASMLNDNPELRSELDARYRYILVDEYQDTNAVQYQIVAALSQNLPNLCVTGDPDQSIYGWRGARIDNILRFEKDFPETQTIRLEQNFRSTKSILKAADDLIVQNQMRKAKSLTTQNVDGDPVELLHFSNAQHEAEQIAQWIRSEVRSGKRQWSDVAIFFRVNSLSRQLELAMTRHNVPFQVANGLAFYDRAEIKDLLAYLRLIANPDDSEAFMRIINKPLRGLGKTSQNRIRRWAAEQHLSLREAVRCADQVPKLSKQAKRSAFVFSKMIDSFDLSDTGEVAGLVKDVILKSGLAAQWQGSSDETDLQRLANMDELVAAAAHYDDIAGDERSLEGFLENTSLASDLDGLDDSEGKVTLMTLHAAKGLEFPVVFIIGVEENLIPHERSLQSGSRREYEEERRLLFVGMTRAQQQLFLTESQVRDQHGRSMYTIPSDFLRDLDLLQTDGDQWGSPSATTTSSSSDVDGNDEAWPRSPRKKKKNKLAGSPLLTTGAALLSGDAGQADLPLGFPIGSFVRHPQYGRGKVLSAGGFGARRTVTVEFINSDDETIEETFVIAKCPLQPVG